METKQINYILTIAEEGSITRAAEKLYMTQSALNQQLLRLERELGVELFTRNGRGVIPTYAGKLYLESARRVLDIRNETYKRLHDISEVKYGEISIGYTPERGALVFSELYSTFHRRYPGISFSVLEARSPQLAQQVQQKHVTMALVSYDDEQPDLVYHSPGKEHIVVAVPITHPLAGGAGDRSWETLPTIAMEQLRGEKLVLSSMETRMRAMLNDAFDRAGMKPDIAFETSVTQLLIRLVEKQVGISFLPQYYVGPSDKMVYYLLEDDLSWNIAMVSHRDTYLNRAERDFVSLYTSYHHSGLPHNIL